MVKNILVILLSINSCLHPKDLDLKKIVKILEQMESLNNNKVIGDNGKAYGILQIHKIYVDEVNMRYNKHYTHQDMFNETRAEEVFYLYMKYAIKRFKKKYNRNPTEQDIVRMHNGGMYKGYKINSTKKYYIKYLKFKNKVTMR